MKPVLRVSSLKPFMLKTNEENWGWAVARNQLITQFMQGDWEICVLQDCDEWLSDPSWPSKVLALREKDPSLHAYMIRTQKKSVAGNDIKPLKTIKLPSGVEADVWQEWYGATNVFDREVINTVGGYDWESIPTLWGFHDPEIGRRLKKSGLLRPCLGYYLDPIRVEGKEGEVKSYRDDQEPMHQSVIKHYAWMFQRKEKQVSEGKAPLFFDYTLLPAPGYFKRPAQKGGLLSGFAR
jgi:hypothetical protein